MLLPRSLQSMLLTWLLLLLPTAEAAVTDLQVTLRGKKYTIPEDVHTVPELRAALSLASGVVRADLDKQSVLFQGTRLEPDAVLKDAGVTNGAALSLVPASGGGGGGKKKKKTSSSSSSSSVATAAVGASGEASTNGEGGMDAMFKEYMKNAGVDPSQLEDMMKSMGGSGAGGSLQDAMAGMSKVMQSPMFKEFMTDPEKLEQSRQMILNNPMLKGMMAGMPGMEELLNDKDAWREAMTAAASIYQNMDQNELMKGIMSGLSGQPPPTSGLFDGATLDAASSKAAAALEELEEDD